MDSLTLVQLWVTMILLIHQALSHCPKCTKDDIHSIKLLCQLKGQQLEEAEQTENATIVCRSLEDLLLCVAEKVPQCLSTFGAETRRYRWTPWDCHLSQTQIYEYQVLVDNGCKPKDVSIKLLPDNKANTVHLGPSNDIQTLNGTSSAIKSGTSKPVLFGKGLIKSDSWLDENKFMDYIYHKLNPLPNNKIIGFFYLEATADDRMDDEKKMFGCIYQPFLYDDLLRVTDGAFDQIGAERWDRACSKVEKVIEEMKRADHYSRKPAPIIINITGSDTEDTDTADECLTDTSATDTADEM